MAYHHGMFQRFREILLGKARFQKQRMMCKTTKEEVDATKKSSTLTRGSAYQWTVSETAEYVQGKHEIQAGIEAGIEADINLKAVIEARIEARRCSKQEKSEEIETKHTTEARCCSRDEYEKLKEIEARGQITIAHLRICKNVIDDALNMLIKSDDGVNNFKKFFLSQQMHAYFPKDRRQKIANTDDPNKLLLLFSEFPILWFDGIFLEELFAFLRSQCIEGTDEIEEKLWTLHSSYIKDPVRIRSTEEGDKWIVDSELKKQFGQKTKNEDKFHYLCEGILGKSIQLLTI